MEGQGCNGGRQSRDRGDTKPQCSSFRHFMEQSDYDLFSKSNSDMKKIVPTV